MLKFANRIEFRLLVLLAFILLALVLAARVAAQAGGGFDLSWHVIANGGGTSAGGDFSLSGTAGQFDAGPLLEGSGYSVSGGYWPPGSKIFLPMVIN